MNNQADVLAYASTKDRYLTTLPLLISSVISQSVRVKKFVLFEDSEPTDIRTNNTYFHLLHMLNFYGIEWEIVFGERKGQVHNHQKAINMCKQKYLWRLDDDNIASPNTLKVLLESMSDEKVGAVGSLVLEAPTLQTITDENIKNDLDKIYSEPNVQWGLNEKRKTPFEVDHLYSTFLYRHAASSHGYNLSLSKVCFREETLFTVEMKKNGWKLLVDPSEKAITWHLREPSGGIREDAKRKEFYDHDEEIFKKKMEELSSNTKDDNFYIVINGGIGDHFMFRSILPDLKEKYRNKLVLAVCYPEVFENDRIKLISIHEAKEKFNGNIDKFDVYRWCGTREWNKSLIDAYREMYLGEK